MKKLVLSLLTVLAVNTCIFAQWVVQKSMPDEFYYSICFTSPNVGYIGGDGKIFKTIDGGINWSVQYQNNGVSFNAIAFPDANIGYAYGNTGIIYKITGADSTWKNVSSLPAIIESMYFPSKDTGYAVGNSTPFPHKPAPIYKTTDGGLNWIQKTSATTAELKSVFFTDNEHGYIAGFDTVFKTNNGGNTWQHIGLPTTGPSFYSIYFPSKDTGYVGGQGGLILKTTDAGLTWAKQASSTSYDIVSVFFTSNDTGYVAANYRSNPGTERSCILKTTDGGKHWFSQRNTPDYKFAALYFADANTGYAIYDGNKILKTSNGGVTGIATMAAKTDIQAYPNPAGSFLQITGLSSDTHTIEITNSLGERVLQTTSETGNIDISVLADGMYYVKVYAAKGEYTVIKFIKN